MAFEARRAVAPLPHIGAIQASESGVGRYASAPPRLRRKPGSRQFACLLPAAVEPEPQVLALRIPPCRARKSRGSATCRHHLRRPRINEASILHVSLEPHVAAPHADHAFDDEDVALRHSIPHDPMPHLHHTAPH